MQSQIETLSPVLIAIKVEVPWTKVEEDLENAYRNMQRRARVRGFRQGKAPRELVKNMYGKAIRSEVAGELVRQGLGQAIEEHKIEPVAYSEDLTAPEITDGAPLHFTAKMEVRPKIDKVDLAGLAAERSILKVDDAAVQADIQRMREQTAELTAPEPARPAKAGDQLTIDLQVSVDGTPRPEMGGQDRRIELDAQRLLPDLYAGLLGVEVGGHKDVTLTFPDDYGYEELRGKSALFHVDVKAMHEKVLPEIDDELAKDLGHDSLAALQSSIRSRLEATAAERAESLMREQLVEKLIDKNPIEVPPSMVAQETRQSLEFYVRLQYMMGQPAELSEELQKQFTERAERKVRAGLLFGAIAKEQNISVSADEVEAKWKELAEKSGKHIAKVRAEYQAEGKRVEPQILEKKLLEYLVSRATITDAVPTAPEENKT